MAFTTITPLSVGHSLQTVFFTGVRHPALVPARELRTGLSQVLWREGSADARRLALNLARADTPESYARVAETLNDHFVRSTGLSSFLTQGASQKALSNEVFGQALLDAANTGFERLTKPTRSDRRTSFLSYFGEGSPVSDTESDSIWEAALARLPKHPSGEIS